MSAALHIMRRNHCHALPIAEFYAATDAHLYAPTGAGIDAKCTQAPENAWPRLIQSAVRFPDEHGPKIARALADFAARWGTRAPGYFSAFAAAAGEEKNGLGLEGIERLDGTLFVRVAGLTFDRLGWVAEGEKVGSWDWDGFPMLELYTTIKGTT